MIVPPSISAACCILCAACHRLDGARRARVSGAEGQAGALPGQAGAGRQPGGAAGESPLGLQPRSVDTVTCVRAHTHVHTHIHTHK